MLYKVSIALIVILLGFAFFKYTGLVALHNRVSFKSTDIFKMDLPKTIEHL
ncbi:hypothetical protein [Alkaliphilus peptidifermentans]|uniref:Uncharacterized protein n=1 Tax=Alkaliphilus peptidifermentans DSM 18978 TaxID=1120976 RepID=A0A1G5IBS0_9FIRM|nr:hypothetical protein [Alkaliphilus peptidifermentans]SCY73575.1 hypothetical protein SAMN03080606_02334 [Alkaliphilus peptidifermentans DSM 18978]